MQAVLWDGQKQIQGKLEFKHDKLEFLCSDFAQTDLRLAINYSSIIKVNHHRLYQLALGGVEILSGHDKSNVFVVDDPKEVMRMIEDRINFVKG